MKMRGALSCTTRLLHSVSVSVSVATSRRQRCARLHIPVVVQSPAVVRNNNNNIRGARPHATNVGTTMDQPSDEGYYFGPIRIPPTQVFAETSLSVGLVNLKPVVPGHVLVVSRRVVARFADLTAAETADIWHLAKRVGGVLEPHFGATSLTYAIQAGKRRALSSSSHLPRRITRVLHDAGSTYPCRSSFLKETGQSNLVTCSLHFMKSLQ